MDPICEMALVVAGGVRGDGFSERKGRVVGGGWLAMACRAEYLLGTNNLNLNLKGLVTLCMIL